MKKTEIGERIKVAGIALKETISLNKVRYTKEEISKAANSLVGKSIIKDHNPITDNAIGMVEKANTMDEGRTLEFEGWVEEDGTGVTRRVSDGRVKVSIGAMVDQLVEESEDSDVVIAKGISFQELSLTPTPGVTGAFIQQKESFDEEYTLTKEDEELIKKAMEEDENPIDQTELGVENEEEPKEEEEKKEVELTDNNQETQTGEIKVEPNDTQNAEVEKTEANININKSKETKKMENEKIEVAKEVIESAPVENTIAPTKAEIVTEEKEAISEKYTYENFEGNLCLYRKPFGRFAK